MTIEGIDFTHLLKARDVFERYRQHLQTDQEKSGAIQAFEFCYEIAWKMMKRVLGKRGIEVNSPRDAFRQAALNHLIDDAEIWFEFIKKRNITVHTYNEASIEEVVAIFDVFSKELNLLIENVQKAS